MAVETLISVEDYLRTSYDPECDYVDGHVLERNVGKTRHSYVQGEVHFWFKQRRLELNLHPLVEERLRVSQGRFRVPDVAVVAGALPQDDILIDPPYICIEILSPEDSVSTLQDRVDDYLSMGVANIWIIDPWKNRAWMVTHQGWASAVDGVLTTCDGKVAMPLTDVWFPAN